MNRIRLCHLNYFPTATVSAFYTENTTTVPGTGVPGLPVRAAQDPDRSYVWRAAPAGVGAHALLVDLGAAQDVRVLAVANTAVLDGGGTIGLAGLGSNATPDAFTDLGEITLIDQERRAGHLFLDTAHTARHFSIYWKNPGAIVAAPELGYVCLGDYFEPSVNVSAPLDMREVDPSIVTHSVDRQRRTVTRSRYLTGRWVWDDVPEADRDQLEALYRAVGTRCPFFTVLDTDKSWSAMVTYLTAPLRVQVREVAWRYRLQMQWEEAT